MNPVGCGATGVQCLLPDGRLDVETVIRSGNEAHR